MFEHLDDEIPFAPDDRLRAAVRRGADRRRARRRRSIAAASVGTPVALMAGALAVRGAAPQVERVSIGAITQREADGRPATLNTDDLDRPFTLLVVGVDGDRRTDAIMVVEVDRPAGQLRMVSVPRDLYVPLAGGPGPAKINSALAQSRETLIATVNQALGVTIDHYAETGMAGFAAMVDATGGVSVAVDAPLRDQQSGLVLDAGCQTLDGATALALARSRHLQVRDPNGRWVADPSTDLGRAARQQVLATAALGRIGHLGGASAMLPLARTAMDHLVADEHLGAREAGELTRWAGTLGPDAIRSMTLPVVPLTVAGADVLEPTPGAAAEVQRFLRGEGGAPPPPSLPGRPAEEAHVRPAPGGAC